MRNSVESLAWKGGLVKLNRVYTGDVKVGKEQAAKGFRRHFMCGPVNCVNPKNVSNIKSPLPLPHLIGLLVEPKYDRAGCTGKCGRLVSHVSNHAFGHSRHFERSYKDQDSYWNEPCNPEVNMEALDSNNCGMGLSHCSLL